MNSPNESFLTSMVNSNKISGRSSNIEPLFHKRRHSHKNNLSFLYKHDAMESNRR